MGYYPFAESPSLTNPMTTAGDLIDGGTGGTPQRLGIGSSGQVLTVSAGAPAWEALPAATNAAAGVIELPASTAVFKTTAPTSTVSTAAVMAGLAYAFTPSSTGIVKVMLTGYATNLSAIVEQIVGARYGTPSSSAPANGAAATGTRWSIPADVTIHAQGITSVVGFTFEDLLTLTPGTSYWFDVTQATNNASDATQLGPITCIIQELIS